MSVLVRFTLPAEEFPLGEVLEAGKGGPIRLESLIPTGDATIPYLWVPTEVVEAVEVALDRSPLAEDVRVIDEIAGESLLRIRWSLDVNGIVDAIRETDGVLLEAWGTGGDWTLRMRFDDHTDVYEFYQLCADRGISLTLDELHGSSTAADDSSLGVTDAQREALLEALEAGYYAIPREVTLEELAGHLDISDTALSQRLRRGLTALLSSTLQQDPADGRE